MYSPKIAEDLVPYIYRVAKAKKISQTVVVNAILDAAIKQLHDELIGSDYTPHRSEANRKPVERNHFQITIQFNAQSERSHS